MRRQMIAEIGGSMVIVALTGLCAVTGLVLGTYYFMSMDPYLKVLGLVFFFVGVENLPIFAMWCRQAAGEYAAMTRVSGSAR